MSFRVNRVPTLLVWGFLVSGCHGSPVAPTPGDQPTPAPTVPSTTRLLTGTYLVVSAVGEGGCGAGREPGQQGRVGWSLTRTGTEIVLDEDLANFPTDNLQF